MAKKSVKELLAEMKQGWRDTEARSGSAQFPEGRGHEGYIKDVSVELNKKGNLQVHWVIVGTSKGIEDSTDHKWSNMATPENRGWLKGEMEAIGLEWPDNLEEIGEALEPADGKRIRFDVKNSKTDEYENHNIYFREELEGSEKAAAKEEEAEEPKVSEPTAKEIKADGREADDGDEDATERLTILAKENDLDPDDFATWVGLAKEIAELY